jgi:enoyl-CoA hydratase
MAVEMDRMIINDSVETGIRTRVQNSIGSITMRNPARLNAMTLSMWHELRSAIEAMSNSPEVRAVVIAGWGAKAFCAGGDISEFGDRRSGSDARNGYDLHAHAALTAVGNCPKPVIATIRGYCLGGGVSLALRCDIRIAAASALFSLPVARLGLSYSFSTVSRLVDTVGASAARRMLYTGRKFKAEEALQMRLVDEVVPDESVEDHVGALAAEIAANAPLSIRASKTIIDMVGREPEERDLDACEAAERACLGSQDYVEATRAFLEKRRPVFNGV